MSISMKNMSSSDHLIHRIIDEAKQFATQYFGNTAQVQFQHESQLLQQEVRRAHALLDKLSGMNERAGAGEYLTHVNLDPLRVMVRYEYERGQEPNFDADSPLAGPGIPPSVSINQLFLNGAWVDAESFDSALLEKWSEAILEEHLCD